MNTHYHDLDSTKDVSQLGFIANIRLLLLRLTLITFHSLSTVTFSTFSMTMTYRKTSASLGSLRTSGFSSSVHSHNPLWPFNCDLFKIQHDHDLDLPENIGQLGVIAHIRLLLLLFTVLALPVLSFSNVTF
jgi:hypothetical protein